MANLRSWKARGGWRWSWGQMRGPLKDRVRMMPILEAIGKHHKLGCPAETVMKRAHWLDVAVQTSDTLWAIGKSLGQTDWTTSFHCTTDAATEVPGTDYYSWVCTSFTAQKFVKSKDLCIFPSLKTKCSIKLQIKTDLLLITKNLFLYLDWPSKTLLAYSIHLSDTDLKGYARTLEKSSTFHLQLNFNNKNPFHQCVI